jgi:hypothetical protein
MAGRIGSPFGGIASTGALQFGGASRSPYPISAGQQR